MNIFSVLNQGKSRMHEPSISALLGYLLDSRADHGLGDSFLREFLQLLSENIPGIQKWLDRRFIVSDVALEEPYQLKGQRKDIDIQLDILTEELDESYRIVVENKIKLGAANPKQLSDYYAALMEDDSEFSNLAMVFLTPAVRTPALSAEFGNLEIRPGHAKIWIVWDGVLEIVRRILEKEVRGDITPINEYMRHTLKAFVQHVDATVTRSCGASRSRADQGEIVAEINLDLDDESVRVIRRSSKQVQVFIDGEKTVAKPVLRKIIDHFSLEIPLQGLNTQRMGKLVIDELLKTGNRV